MGRQHPKYIKREGFIIDLNAARNTPWWKLYSAELWVGSVLAACGFLGVVIYTGHLQRAVVALWPEAASWLVQ